MKQKVQYVYAVMAFDAETWTQGLVAVFSKEKDAEFFCEEGMGNKDTLVMAYQKIAMDAGKKRSVDSSKAKG